MIKVDLNPYELRSVLLQRTINQVDSNVDRAFVDPARETVPRRLTEFEVKFVEDLRKGGESNGSGRKCTSPGCCGPQQTR